MIQLDPILNVKIIRFMPLCFLKPNWSKFIHWIAHSDLWMALVIGMQQFLPYFLLPYWHNRFERNKSFEFFGFIKKLYPLKCFQWCKGSWKCKSKRTF